MQRVIFTFLLTLSLFSVAEDDYDLAYFGKDATFNLPQESSKKVILYFAKDVDDLHKQWKFWNYDDPIKAKWTIKGFSLVADGTCIIVIPAFNKWDDRSSMAVLGHETLHCMGAEHGPPVDTSFIEVK